MLAREVTRAQATQVQRPPNTARPLAPNVNQANMRDAFLSSPPSVHRYEGANRFVQSTPSRQTPFVAPKVVASPTLKRPAPDSRGFLNSLSQGDSSQENRPPIIIEDDLPRATTISKLHEDVYFDEHDFDDVVDLDSDNEPPVGQSHTLQPASHSRQPKRTETQGPAVTAVNASGLINSTPIGWSSSPVAHKATPPNAALLRRPMPDNQPVNQGPVQIDLTSDTTDDVNPRPKKRRNLPWKTEQAEEADEPVRSEHFQQSYRKLSKEARVKVIGGTPKPSPRSQFFPASTETPKAQATPAWEKTASAIKEDQKKLRKANKKMAKAGDVDTSVQTRTVTTSKSKRVEPIFLSDEQKRILELVVDKGKSVFFTGSAGTGKSVLLREIIANLRRKYRREPDRVAVTASTGLAACNVGGVTLHSFGGIGLGKEGAEELVKRVKKNQKARNRWARTKVLIVDEISMVDGDLFDKLESIAKKIRGNGKPFGGMQLIITGDFFQLPPVPDYGKVSKFAFDAETWSTSIEHTIGLTQVFRQKDPVFANVLNEMRLGILSPESIKIFRSLSRPIHYEDNLDATELFPTRHEVENANRQRMRNLTGECMSFAARDGGLIQDKSARDKLLANCMAPQTLELKKGAQVMLIKNFDESLVNGSLGKVMAFMEEKTYEIYHQDEEAFQASSSSDVARPSQAPTNLALEKVKSMINPELRSEPLQLWPLVRFAIADGSFRDLLCVPETWKIELPGGEVQASRSQVPLILAWSLSIHKAQGQTLERVKVDLGKVFEKGQAYVALSRATCQEGLQVLRFDPKKVMAHERVRTFYRSLYSVDEASKPAKKAKFTTPAVVGSAARSHEDEQHEEFDRDAWEAMAAYA